MKSKILISIVSLGILAGCTAPERTERVLQEQGYTDIQIKGYSWLSCSEDDVFRTKFEAKSPVGYDIKGTVCSGWFKGNTIRLD